MSILPTGLTLESEAHYLRTLPAIRERCNKVFDLAQQGKLQYFTYHPENEEGVAEYCVRYMRGRYRDFSEILPHSRWRHLDTSLPRIAPLLSSWSSQSLSQTDQAKRLLDLFVVSVLLDAGAGAQWSYLEHESGERFARSEGLGVASVRMFERGVFSTDEGDKCRVDAEKLKNLTPATLGEHMQVSEENPLVGLEGRAELLRKLGEALSEREDIFVGGRPGGIVDYLTPLLSTSSNKPTLPLPALWDALMTGLGPIWPKRHSLAGVELGDVWPCEALREAMEEAMREAMREVGEGAHLVPFHKLTQWLTYSLLEIFTNVLGWEVVGGEDMTGLPEYRNGGLLIDLSVLQLKPPSSLPGGQALPTHPQSGLVFVKPSHPMVVEWRALTVVLLIASQIRTRTSSPNLTLAQILEAATWNCGRMIAKEKREGGGPPVEIDSDGTVF